MPIEHFNGIDFYYESHGEGPVVTFLHGAGGNHISWWQQIPEFSQHYRCITIDHRNFGQSTDPDLEGADRYADDLEALFERLGVERTALVAQSMGGRTAMDFAVRHPDRAWAMALCDNWGFFDWPDLLERIAASRDPAPRPGGMGTRYVTEHPGGAFLYQELSALNGPRGPRAVSTSTVSKAEVAALTVPTLLLVGSEDPTFPPPIIRAVHDLMPGSQYVELDGCGHSGYFEGAVEFNERVGTFLAAHRPA